MANKDKGKNFFSVGFTSKKVGAFFKVVGILILNVILAVVLSLLMRFTKINIEVISFIPNFISVLLLVFIFKRTLYISFKKENFKKALCGIFGGAVFSLILFIILIITSQGRVNLSFIEGISREGIVFGLVLPVLSVFLFVIPREIMLRGYVFNSLNKKISIVTTIILVSFLSSFWDLNVLGVTPIIFLNKFLYSLLLTLFIYNVSSIEYSICFSVVVSLVMGLGIETKGMDLLSGGSVGPIAGLIFTAFAILSIVFYIAKNNIKVRLNIKTVLVPAILCIFTIWYIGFDFSVWGSAAVVSENVAVKTAPINNDLNNYNMQWRLELGERKIYGTQEVSYINNSHDDLEEVYFHAYAAAFKEYNGNIIVEEVSVGDIKGNFEIEGEDETLIKIPLKDKLNPNERVSIEMKYIIEIPERSGDGFADRFAVGDNTINLGNCFPIAAVYEGGEWDKHLYDKKGDAFYSESSNFIAKIEAPKKYELAVTGEIKNIEEVDGKQIWSIEAGNVRDFAAVASDRIQMVEVNIEGTIIKSYAVDKRKAKKALEISKKAIKTFNRRFGEYPYGTFSVVQTDLSGGMEYPSLVMIESGAYDNVTFKNILYSFMYNGALGMLEEVTVHEIAHQWWYGVVGNDEFNESWVDEPLTQFSTLLYYKDNYSEDLFNRMYTLNYGATAGVMSSKFEDKSFKRPLDKFEDDEYVTLIYLMVPTLIKEKYDELGDEKFNEILRQTFDKFKFKVLKGEDFPLDLAE